jgi:hypothetical protein
MASTVFHHAHKFYTALDERAKDELWDNGAQVRVFRGKVTIIFRSLEISQSYYGRVKTGLTESGCISFAQVGSRGKPSAIILHHPPLAEEFALREGRPLTKTVEAAMLSQRMEGIENRLGGMNVVEALANVESRLRDLDSRVRQQDQEIITLKQQRR